MQLVIRIFFLLVIIALFNQVSFSQNTNRTDSLIRLIKNSEEDTAKLEDLKAIVQEFQRTDLAQAMKYCEEGLLLAEKIGSSYYIEEFLGWKGEIYSSQGQYAKALDMTLRAIQFAEELKDSLKISKRLNTIGGIYFYQNQFEEAISYYKQVLTLNILIDDKERVASACSNIGASFCEAKKLDSSLFYHLKALAISEIINNKGDLAECWINIGNVYYYKEDYDKAINYYFRAQEIYREVDDKYVAAALLINIGSIYSKTNRFSEAIKSLHKAIVLSEDVGLKDLTKEAYLTIAIAYSRKNDWKSAYHYYEQYSGLKDSIFSEESYKQMAEMQTKYDTEKKEKEIILLTKDKNIQELQLSKNKADLNKQRVISYSVISGLALLLGLIFFILKGYREKQKANKELDEKNQKIEQAYSIIEKNRDEIAEQNKDITDSIRYAKRIQEAILPPDKMVKQFLPESFILYQPKDIVSGDFYWCAEKNGKVLIAAVDCTGHGVPGAFMSIVGNNLLTQAVNEQRLTKPAEILDYLNTGVNETLRQSYEDSKVRDGMDIALCNLDVSSSLLQFAGANNPLWIIRDKELIEVKSDKQPIGSFLGEELKPFTNREIPIQKEDVFYIFSDGYPDQFGGPKGKKFKYAQLKALLMEIHQLPMAEQQDVLQSTIKDWKGNLEQVDDILVIGIRV